MEKMISDLVSEHFGYLIAIGGTAAVVFFAGLIAKFLKADGNAKLRDKDPKNDAIGRAEVIAGETIEEHVKRGTIRLFFDRILKKPRGFIVFALLLSVFAADSAFAQTAAATPQSAIGFNFTCGTTAARIQHPTETRKDYKEILVWNAACSGASPNTTCVESATPVFVGSIYSSETKARTATITTLTGTVPICNTSACVGKWISFQTANLDCIASANTVIRAVVLR